MGGIISILKIYPVGVFVKRNFPACARMLLPAKAAAPAGNSRPRGEKPFAGCCGGIPFAADPRCRLPGPFTVCQIRGKILNLTRGKKEDGGAAGAGRQ
jgi:hypothetical protein